MDSVTIWKISLIIFKSFLESKPNFQNVPVAGSSFSSKVKIRGMLPRLLEHIPEDSA